MNRALKSTVLHRTSSTWKFNVYWKKIIQTTWQCHIKQKIAFNMRTNLNYFSPGTRAILVNGHAWIQTRTCEYLKQKLKNNFSFYLTLTSSRMGAGTFVWFRNFFFKKTLKQVFFIKKTQFVTDFQYLWRFRNVGSLKKSFSK